MPSLLCSYASERSHPRKIQKWVDELSELRRAHASDPVRAETIDILLRRARQWLHSAGTAPDTR